MTLMKQSLSPTSVNRKLSALQSFFTYAVRMGFVQKHPLRFVNGPKKPKPLPYFIKEKDINGLLDGGTADKGMAYRDAGATSTTGTTRDAAGTILRVTKSHAPRTGMTGMNLGTGTTDRGLGMSGTNSDVSSDGGDCRFEAVRDLLMLEMLYATGIRCSELVGIKDRDVDMEAMLIKVTGKRNKQRLIPFAQQLKDVIYNYYNVRAKEVGEGCASFFTRKDGRAVTSAIVYYVIKKQLSGIPTLAKRSPHVLRHTFATNMLNNGATLSGVSRLLGHSSLASTSVYTHVTFEELKKVYNAHPRAKI
jgi:site-specific recombinase XerD